MLESNARSVGASFFNAKQGQKSVESPPPAGSMTVYMIIIQIRVSKREPFTTLLSGQRAHYFCFYPTASQDLVSVICISLRRVSDVCYEV